MAHKKCKVCRAEYMPANAFQKVCGLECAKVMASKQIKKVVEKEEKAKRADFRKRKAALKPKRTILNEAQAAFNDYVRYRDKDCPCINTGNYVSHNGNDSDAAHYVSRAANNAMRFDLRNVNKATKASNKQQEKYIHDYTENLKAKLGPERFEQFLEDCKYWKVTQRNFSKDYLERVKRIFRKKKRVLMKIRGDA